MENLTSSYKTFAIIFIICILVFSVCFLSGWVLNNYELKGGGLGEGAVNPVTAINFILLSIAFIFSVGKRTYNHWGKYVVIPAIAISLIRLAEMGVNFPSNVSEIFFASQIAADYAADKPNAIAPNTAIEFILLGSSILLLLSKKRIARTSADIVACVALLISSLSVIGRLYDTPEFYFINSLVPMVPATAVCFSMLSLAILFYRSDSGLFSVFTSQYQGSRIARYLLPLAIIIPIAAGGLSLYGQRAGIYSAGYGTAMFSMVTVVLLVFLIWQSAISINRSNRQLVQEVKTTKQLSKQLQIEQQRAFEQKLMLTKMKLNQQLIEATINGQEKEKKQMGMELHDHINQILASTKLYIEMATTDEKMRYHLLRKSNDQLSYAISEIRNLSKSMVLHTETTGGIRQQMYEMIAHVELTTSMNITLKIPDNILNLLDAKKQVAIYRIVEEQLNNIIKHARASRVAIEMLRRDKTIQLYIEDNGRGFDPETSRRGIGLSNMQSRTEMLHGQMDIISGVGQGCVIKIVFPETLEESDVAPIIGKI
jgi:signal transduction histidine kinase